ncbi:hypothetical protein M426DRAFT_75321 [Hypoxylon sp. CI-4A]|nr:hypothetical protein M426DRAFT_75321 [Hypoxylon sp. CI-4A]
MAVLNSLISIFTNHGLISFSIAVAIVALPLLLRFIFFYTKARLQFPGPPVRNLLVGNLDQTMANDVHEKWLQWNREYGHVYQTWNGLFSRVIYIGDPRIISEIATTNWPKSETQYEGFRPLDGDALFVQTDTERWKMQSKRLAPAFQPHIIQGQYGSLKKHIMNYIGQLDRAAQDNTVADLSSLHILLSIDFIGEIAFGTNFRALEQGPSCRISQLLEMILPELMKCGLFPLRGKIPIFEKTRIMNRAIAELRGMAEDAVRDSRQKNKTQNEKGYINPGKKIFEILAFRFPSGWGRSNCAYNLRNPEILAKVRDEVDASIPLCTDIPTLDQVKLPYLNMVLKETLRYSSPGFGTFRICAVDTTVAGVKLPANTTLALWNPAVHRDPRLWKDADKFDPERWRAGDTKTKGAYFPFSYGPRSCTGKGLAMFEMTLTLATLFRRYDMRLEDNFELEYLPSFTLKPKNGLPVRLTRRVI